MSSRMNIIFLICTNITNPKIATISLTCSTNRIIVFYISAAIMTVFSLLIWRYCSYWCCHLFTINPVAVLIWSWGTHVTKVKARTLRTSKIYWLTFQMAKRTYYSFLVIVLLNFFDRLNRLKIFLFILFLHIQLLHKNTI